LLKAEFDGANTVKGPFPFKVWAKPECSNALTNVFTSLDLPATAITSAALAGTANTANGSEQIA
jgi:hypothetical protein